MDSSDGGGRNRQRGCSTQPLQWVLGKPTAVVVGPGLHCALNNAL